MSLGRARGASVLALAAALLGTSCATIARPAPSPALGALPLESARFGADGRHLLEAAAPASLVLVAFFGTWTAEAPRLFEELEGLHDRWSARGLRVVAVLIDEDRRVSERFLREAAPAFPVITDVGARESERLGLRRSPSLILAPPAGPALLVQEGALELEEVERVLAAHQ